MKIFYKNSYKLIDGYTLCLDCPFHYSNICIASINLFHCGIGKLELDNTQIFDL